MSMRALVIAPQPFFSARGTPLSVYYRTLIMAELGVQADFITYGEGLDVDIPGLRIIRIPRFKWLGNVKVGPSYLKLFLDFFLTFRVVAQLIVRRYDFVHAHEEAIFICRFLKPLFGFKLVYDMHSNLAQQLTNTRFTRSGFLKRLFRRLQDSCIRTSEVVITICPDLADYVTAIPQRTGTHILIENSIFDPVRLVQPGQPAPAAADPPHPAAASLPADCRVVLYAGTLEAYQGIELLLQAFREVLRASPDAFLLVVGGAGDQVRHFQNVVQSLGIGSRVKLTGNRPQAEVPGYLAQASVLVSPRTRGTNTPLKIYQQLASGVPLVATCIESHTQVLDDSVAFLAAPEPGAFAQAMVSALTREDEARARAQRAQQLYADRYARSAYTEKMRRMLAMVAGTCAE
jgi:glycosyltransferase involved in cell wall biosynthesis